MVGILATIPHSPYQCTGIVTPHTPSPLTPGGEGSGTLLATVAMATSPPPDLFSDCVKQLWMWSLGKTMWQPSPATESFTAGEGVAMVNWE